MEALQHPNQQTTQRPILAQTYLSKQGDRGNSLLLSDQSLQVYYHNKGRAFGLEYVQYLALEHRKLWLPLIGGGILASLCFLALLKTFSMPYQLLTGAAVGLLGVWWGYMGTMALVVYEQRHHTDFLVRYPSDTLPVFIAFANRVIRRYPEPLGAYCVALAPDEWQQLQKNSKLELVSPRQCLPQDIAQRQNAGTGLQWAAFNPLLLGPRLHWSLNNQELATHLKGTIYAHEIWLLPMHRGLE